MTAARGRPADAWLRVLSLLCCLVVWQLVAQTGIAGRCSRPPQSSSRASGGTSRPGSCCAISPSRWAAVAAAFAIAMGIGAGLGILMGRRRWVDAGLDGLLVLALNIPALVTAILCYIWLGLTEVAAVTAVALNKIPTVVVTVREGRARVDQGLLDVATVFRCPGLGGSRESTSRSSTPTSWPPRDLGWP